MSLLSFIHTEPGDDHANEDVVLVRPHPEDAGLLLCSVADGQGGQAGGAAAARVAVEESLRAAASFPAKELRQAAPWYAILSAADDAVAEADDAGFCTLISLCVSEHQVCGASCGDSGALLLNGGQEILLTEDQRKNPPVGSSAAHPVAFSARLKAGWKLLVVSDGVWKYVGWEHIAGLTAKHQGEALIAALRQAAWESGGGRLQDDFSVVLLHQVN